MSEKEKIVVDAAFMVDDRKTMPCTVAIYLSQEYNISLSRKLARRAITTALRLLIAGLVVLNKSFITPRS